ncbi:hypothetical protein FQN57_001471 [Myotisia sp. PD_48]|nr:hypothetical protein FQN57_001471 [Myotisia sp. PD_48]
MSPTAMTPTPESELEVDALIVGAGFSGCYMLHKLRSAGFRAKIVEAGDGYGGTWHWNCYPGARVDSPVPIYEYSIPELWKTWSWSERFPSGVEIQQYFNHVDSVLGLRKDTIWNTKVTGANFDEVTNHWIVQTASDRRFRATYLILATGFAAKRSFPDWPGLEKFKGEIHHSSFWPHAGIDLANKRVGVVGTGSTGLQIAQTIEGSVKTLTVFQRTPNLALPLLQEKFLKENDAMLKESYPEQFHLRLSTFAGYPYDTIDRGTFDDSPEEREAFYEMLWAKGGFHFWLATYNDLLSNIDANHEAYRFWRKKVRSRINDPAIADALVPLIPPHPFGTKRPSLEWKWFDMFNEAHVKLVDIKNNPVDHVEERGIVTKDGKLHELDAIALATGFDAITGGLKAIDIRSVDGQSLSECWEDGVKTALGLMVSGFPNMFFLYGPQGPTAFSNGPSCVDIQGDWITATIETLRSKGLHTINPCATAHKRWNDLNEAITSKTLFPQADSWYMGANIPGKPRQMLNFTGGLPAYSRELAQASANGYQEFVLK